MMMLKTEELENDDYVEDLYWFINRDDEIDCIPFQPNNIWFLRSTETFKTRREAEEERDKRNLIKRFTKFRDELNDCRKINWEECYYKHYIYFHHVTNNFQIGYATEFNDSVLFGFFKTEEDCQFAIEAFRDDLYRLYIKEKKL